MIIFMILFPSQCGFRKGYSSQNCFLAMLENFKKSADNGNEFGALLTNLSKAFYCIDHKLLIAKHSVTECRPQLLI